MRAPSSDDDAISYDSDAEPPPPIPSVRSSWRLDPEESLSDWTIQIIVRANHTSTSSGDGDEITTTYHVHKFFLAVGPRKSEYFATLFSKGGRFAEAKDCTSRIPLDELAARSFPILLDYLYSETYVLPLDTNNATAIHSMAKYFDMRRLRWEAKQFWRKDIQSPTACGVYYEHARMLKDDKVMEAATESCSKNILRISKTSRLVHVADPEFWLQILRNYKNVCIASEKTIGHISILIAAFTQQHHSNLETHVFQKLTDEELLPYIHVAAALPLMEAERKIVAPEESILTNLQKRCVAALVYNWSHMDFRAQGDIMELAKKQSPLVLAEILAGVLCAAKADKTKLKSDLQAKSREVESKTVQLNAKTADLNAKNLELSKFKRLLEPQSCGLQRYAKSLDETLLPESHQTEQHGANFKPNGSHGALCPLFYYEA